MDIGNNTGIEVKFFSLLQLAVGSSKEINYTITDDEWHAIYKLSMEQSLTAVILRAADELSKISGCKPPLTLLYTWIGQTENIKERSKMVTLQCQKLAAWFSNLGYANCILKGQGVAKLYHQPDERQAGDIDIWVDADRDEIVDVMRFCSIDVTYVDYVNCHASFFTDTEVEVHFRPTWMFNPYRNWKVQKWIKEKWQAQMDNYDSNAGFGYPTIGFNLVFSLIHIYRHVFFEGIGLRQLTDYYYILYNSTAEERDEALKTLRSIGMEKFVGAVMYIMKRVFNINDELLLCKPNEVRGERLLSEIIKGGNFGKYDNRNKYVPNDKKIRRGINNWNRNVRFVKDYPSEVLWMPLWKIWHWVWRKWKGYLR